MPLAALSRKAYEGFRLGDYSSLSEECVVAFDTPWDLDPVKPDFFPVPSSVVLGKRIAPVLHTDQIPLPASRLVASGHLDGNAGAEAGHSLTWSLIEPDANLATYTEANSPYARRFRQGATLAPRFLILVEVENPGPLQPRTHRSVRSRRGRLDKEPWRLLPDLTGVVEQVFIKNAFMGEHCLPFRMLPPVEAVLPIDGREFLSGADDRIDRFPGLAQWWRTAEQVWMDHRSSDRLTLNERVDYHGALKSQYPISPIRVVYTKAGNYLTAATVTDDQAIIDTSLYWGAASSQEEAWYISTILNSPVLGELVAPYQSRGAFGPRHFDKYVWYPPIPEYDASNEGHHRLVELGKQASEIVAAFEIPDGVGFQRARSLLRAVLQSDGLFDRIDDEVCLILVGTRSS